MVLSAPAARRAVMTSTWPSDPSDDPVVTLKLLVHLYQAWFLAIEKKTQGKITQNSRKNLKLKKISQNFGIFEVNFWYQMFHLLYIWRNCIWKVSEAAVLGKLGPRPGPVVLRPGGYRASGRLDRAGYPAWPLYTLDSTDHHFKLDAKRSFRGTGMQGLKKALICTWGKLKVSMQIFARKNCSD